MTVEKLERVMWRIRKDNPDNKTPLWSALNRAVMLEIGTDKRTYILNRKALIKLKWITGYSPSRFKITDADLG